MPGKLFLDPQRIGVHAFKPIVAAAYCQGYTAFMTIKPRNAPPGLTGESLENWFGGYDDAGAGIEAQACGYPAGIALGPELVPDPYFQNWSGAPSPDNTPDGWSLTGQSIGNEYGEGVPYGFDGISDTAPTNSLTSLGDLPAALSGYRIAWYIRAQAADVFTCILGGVSTRLEGDIGVVNSTTIATLNTNALQIGPAGNNCNQQIGGLSVRLVL